MIIPSDDQFFEPLLRFLSEQAEPVRTKQVYEALAKRVGWTPKQVPGSVVLIVGKRLSELMIEHGVGASHEEFRIPKITWTISRTSRGCQRSGATRRWR